MKKLLCTFLGLSLSLSLVFAGGNDPSLKEGFTQGNPQIQSINSLAFGPEGILFMGDSQKGEIIALDTQDEKAGQAPESISLKRVDVLMASLLGLQADEITIQDMAVNPLSQMIYFAVQTPEGAPVLLRTAGKTFEVFDLEDVSYSKISLEKAIAADAKDRRGRPLRKWAISDLAYKNGKVYVSGLSNEEFSSTFRSISFPFTEKQNYAALEIYHAAHGRYETYAPIKTFLPYTMAGKEYLVASYTCTPLVIFPIDQLKNGELNRGKTVAELGNRNTPLDIISYTKEGKEYLLMANSSRSLMKIDPEKVSNFQDFLTQPVSESSATAGVEFIALPYVLVQQMDNFTDEKVLLLQRMANGDLNLHTPNIRRL